MIKLLLCLPLLATTSLVEPNKDVAIEGMTDSRDYSFTLAQAPTSISTRMDSEDWTIIYQPNYVVNSPALNWQFNLQSGHDFDVAPGSVDYTLTDWLGGVSLLSENKILRESVYDTSFSYADFVQYAYRPGMIFEDWPLEDNSRVGLINGYRFSSDIGRYYQTSVSNITFQWDKFIWKTNESHVSQDYYLVFNDVQRSANYRFYFEASYIISYYDYNSNTWQYETRNESGMYLDSTDFNAISGDVPGFYIPIFSSLNVFDYIEFDYQMITNCQITIRCAGSDSENVEIPYSIVAPIQENSNYNEETQLMLDYLQYRDNFLPPAEELNVDFVGWIGLAIGSFINFEIVPGFSIGGIFSALIMIAFAIWIIKMFLGG